MAEKHNNVRDAAKAAGVNPETIAKFTSLHKKRQSALRKNDLIIAHEILAQIQVVVDEINSIIISKITQSEDRKKQGSGGGAGGGGFSRLRNPVVYRFPYDKDD